MYKIFYNLTSIGISIIYLLITFININQYKLNRKEYLMMILFIASSFMVIFALNSNLATIPLYVIPILFIYKKSHKIIESLILGIFITLVIIVVNNFTGIIVIKIMSPEFLASTLGYSITCVLIGLILYPISKLIGKLLIKYKEFILENYKSKYLILVYIMLILTFGLFYININWNKSSNAVYLTKVNGIVFTIYGVTMSFVSLSIFFVLKKEEKFKHKQIQLDNLKEYTENLEKLYMDMRKFRHDYVNIISTIAGFIDEKKLEDLEEYFNKHIYPLNSQMNKNNYKLVLLKNIKLTEIKGLISAKVIHAQELGIDIILDIVEPITRINMDIIDFSRCLGIILDNAIEASLESEKRVVNISLINKKTSVIIIVINTFKGELPPLFMLFKEEFSTKGKNRGLGLTSLKEIIGKYRNISLDTYIKEDVFVQEITVSNK